MKWLVLALALPAAALADDPQAAVFADRGSPATLRAAIGDLLAEFGPRYPSGNEFLRRLDLIEKQMSAGTESARAAFSQLQREALVANPLVSGAPLVFVERQQYAPDHHNTGTDFQPGEISAQNLRAGAAIKTVDFGRGGRVQTLLTVPDGVAARSGRALRRHADRVRDAAQRTGQFPHLRDEQRRQRPAAAHAGVARHGPRSRLSARRPDRVRQHARHQILRLQPARPGQPVRHERRRFQHPPDQPQQPVRLAPVGHARWPHPVRSLGIRGPRLRAVVRLVDGEPRRHAARTLLRQQRVVARRDFRCPDHPRLAALRGDLQFVPRPAVGRDGDHRPRARPGRRRAGRAELARRHPCRICATARTTARARTWGIRSSARSTRSGRCPSSTRTRIRSATPRPDKARGNTSFVRA